jgi:hypothetical protein
LDESPKQKQFKQLTTKNLQFDNQNDIIYAFFFTISCDGVVAKDGCNGQVFF